MNERIKKKPEALTKKELEVVGKWAHTEAFSFYQKSADLVYGWPGKLENDFSFLLNQLRVLYSGTIIGELMREKLVPDHALAMSNLLRDTIERTALDYENAIQYLRRKDIKIETTTKSDGKG